MDLSLEMRFLKAIWNYIINAFMAKYTHKQEMKNMFHRENL